MLIFNENTTPILIDDIQAPVVSNYFWVLDLEMQDYTLAPLQVLEETTCPTVTLRVDRGVEFNLPANWYILICDEESGQLDVVQLSNAAGEDFSAVVFGTDCNMMKTIRISIVGYSASYVNVGPSLNKHQMLCHPINPKLWINVSPNDPYNKYLKDLTAGELF